MQHPADLIIGTVDQDLQGVLPCDAIRICRMTKENRLVWPKAVGHSIGVDCQSDRPAEVDGLARTLAQQAAERALLAAPRRRTYQLRRRREALIERDRALRTFVVDRLAEGWTPEQISGWLKGGNERGLRVVGCETIYLFAGRRCRKAGFV